MKPRIWRPVAAAAVLIFTVTAFIYYFVQHPEVRQQLAETSPWILGGILALYLCFTACLALVNYATFRLCNISMGRRESVTLTIYSSIINFFGPLQSGPAFRGVYAKKKYDINLKTYAAATFMYYFFYAFFSGLFLLSGLMGEWLIVIGLAGIGLIFFAHRSKHPRLQSIHRLNLSSWYLLAAATLLQVCIYVAIYYLELRSVLPDVSLAQTIVYAGAANLALFVSITPGAIGFRESFLVFSQNLHHVGNGSIVIANTIDRAMYISMLLILAAILFGTHAQKQFSHLRKNK